MEKFLILELLLIALLMLSYFMITKEIVTKRKRNKKGWYLKGLTSFYKIGGKLYLTTTVKIIYVALFMAIVVIFFYLNIDLGSFIK